MNFARTANYALSCEFCALGGFENGVALAVLHGCIGFVEKKSCFNDVGCPVGFERDIRIDSKSAIEARRCGKRTARVSHRRQCLSFAHHSERIGEIVPACKRNAFVDFDSAFSALKSAEKCRRFVIVEVECESDLFRLFVAVLQVESKRAFRLSSAGESDGNENHIMTFAPHDG